MLYDRPYMRNASDHRALSPLYWLLGILVGCFVIQLFFARIIVNLIPYFGLSPDGFRAGYIWTLVTYAFLHEPRSLFHLLVNTLALYFLGRQLLPVLGTRRFFTLFFGTAFLGGLCWLIVNFGRPGVVLGASASVFGMLAMFACLYPNQKITFLLFFIIPVTIKPKYLAIALAGIDLIGFLAYELPGGAYRSGIAHSAHLGGILGGLIYFRYFFANGVRSSRPSRGDTPAWLRKKPGGPRGPGQNYQVNISSRSDLRAEVDRILDKINSSGFGALTPEEKRLLDEAKDLLSRR